jgi:hypothetical protein
VRRTESGDAICSDHLQSGLRDIEACLSAQSSKLYHMGLRGPVHRSTLPDANEARDWRKRLYASDDLHVDLTSTNEEETIESSQRANEVTLHSCPAICTDVTIQRRDILQLFQNRSGGATQALDLPK